MYTQQKRVAAVLGANVCFCACLVDSDLPRSTSWAVCVQAHLFQCSSFTNENLFKKIIADPNKQVVQKKARRTNRILSPLQTLSLFLKNCIKQAANITLAITTVWIEDRSSLGSD